MLRTVVNMYLCKWYVSMGHHNTEGVISYNLVKSFFFFFFFFGSGDEL